ncbi:translation initiation factor IF-2 [Rhipicephalus sanguineus]|uniref:translation initiation factor IF-2 n=1 Tax=Rhipicephalus sanguineus TaxID=34632 RepID=UPI0018961712|nr:translation initiation factor IF-2 [Rhipicephalus sanguineus]
MDRHGSFNSRRDVSERPPPRGEPPHPPSSSRPQRAQTSQQTPLRRTPRRRQRRPYAPPLDRRYPAAVSPQPPAQPREPAASPQSRYRDVATWTSQDGVDPPVAYVSSRPWRRQERARVGTPPARLYRLFQGRTVADADRRANGACLPVPTGTRLCPCGAVMVHDSHAQSKLHRRRTGHTQPPSREASEERPSEAARAMLARAAREADFAQWLLTIATGHAARAGPPEGLPAEAGTAAATATEAGTAAATATEAGTAAATATEARTAAATATAEDTTVAALGAAATPLGAPAAPTAEPPGQEGMDVDHALLAFLDDE